MALTLEYFYHHTQSKYQLCLLTPTANLYRLISWVHLVEDRSNCSFLRGNELIITTGMETAKPGELLPFVQQLADQHACGLVLNMGPYISSVPQEVNDWCLAHRFPLFAMPWEVHIADIMQDYCNEIISEKRTQDLRTEALEHALHMNISEKDIPVLEGFRGCFLLVSDQELSFPWYAHVRMGELFYYASVTLPSVPKEAHCGVSEPVSSPYSLPVQAKHAGRALTVSRIRSESLTHFRNIGLYNTVLAIDDPEVFAQAEKLLSPLTDPALRQTLRSWLEHDGSIQAVAQELFMHRNTVNFRIKRLRRIFALDTALQKTELLLAFYMEDVRRIMASDE